MKSIISLIFFFCLLFACKDKSSNKNIILKEKVDLVETKSHDSATNIDDSILKNKKISQDCNTSFNHFLEKFGRDSIFQKNRVKYPIKSIISYHDFDERKDTIAARLFLNKNEFNYIDFTEDRNAINNEYDKYEVSIEHLDDLVNYKLIGIDNGIYLIYKFKLIHGC